MKDFKISSVLFISACLFFIVYFVALDNRFDFVEDLHDFPVPKKAVLVREIDTLKDYYWDRSDGANIPASYRLMIWKSGWRTSNIDISLIYEKDGNYISFSPATDYFDISDFTPYVEAHHAN